MAKGQVSVKAGAVRELGQRAGIVAKGVIRGTVWGLVLGGAGVVSASLVAPQPAGNTPPAPPQVDVAETPTVATPNPSMPESTAATEPTEVAATPRVAAPQQSVTAPIADSDPLALPETPDIAVTLALPDAPDVPDIAPEAEEPVLPNPQSLAPQVPTNEGDLVIETTPATPVEVVDAEPSDTDEPAPDVQEVLPVETPPAVAEAAPAEIIDTSPDRATPVEEPDVAELADVAPEPAPEPDAPQEVAMADVAAPATQPAADVAPVAPAEQPQAETAPVAPADQPEAEAAPAAPAETPEVTTPEVITALPEEDSAPDLAEAEVETAPESPAPDALETTDTPDSPATQDAPVVVSIIDAPTNSLPQGAGGVKINRVGGSTAVEEAPEDPAPAPPDIPDDAPALQRYAATFENPDDKPLMALILLDDPGFAEAPRALSEVPFSVTVLIDPALPGAAERMAAYRANGIELGVALSLPQGAQPADVEVALEASFGTLPETIALANTGAANRTATGQMLAALAAEGRGFISLSSGLNSGLRAADAAGVPAVEVFRDLDGDGQDARVIRRFLDQAAFRARQNSGVVVLGRMRADTLSALILWGTANRAGQVAMAPVSALMQEDPN